LAFAMWRRRAGTLAGP